MTDGQSDAYACPDWYPLIRTARYINVAPWELLEPGEQEKVPRRYWRIWAGIAESAEAEAREAMQKAHK